MAGDEGGAAPARSSHRLAAAVLGALTLLWFRGVLLHLRTRLASGLGDASVFLWAWDAQPAALAGGRNPFATRHLFFPVGADLGLATTAPLVGFLTWPVQRVGGAALQLNLVQIGTTFLAPWAAYLLALRVCGRTGPAILAGAAFAFAPHRLVQMGGHLNIVHTFWIPLSLLALLNLRDRPGRRTAVLLGACMGGALLTDPQIALLVLVALLPLLVHRRSDVRRAVRAGAGAIAIAAVLALPVLVPLLLALSDREADPHGGVGQAEAYSPAGWSPPRATPSGGRPPAGSSSPSPWRGWRHRVSASWASPYSGGGSAPPSGGRGPGWGSSPASSASSTGTDVVGDVAAGREDSLFLYYATVHGRPLVSGSIARYPTRRLTRLNSDPLYRQVLALEDEPGYADPPTFTGTDLATAGIGFVVPHRDRPAPRAEAYLQGLGLSVLADDGTVVVLRTPAAGT